MGNRHFLTVFLVITALSYGGIAAEGEKTVSITFSPFHLALPALELTGEYALNQKAGAALIFGAGKLSATNSLGEKTDIPLMETGAQGKYYLLGNFRHGVPVGIEVLWLKLFMPEDEGVSVSANGLAIGPFVGYKWAAMFGLTFDLQIGYQKLFAQAKGTDNTGREVEASAEDAIVLLNINGGWSF